MAAGRPILGLLALFFVAGALLLMFLTFLGGVRNSNPINDIYFLQADTSAIPGAPSTSRWTFWNLCAVSADGKSDCGATHPDFPFDPPSPRNFGTTVNVPSAFVGTNHYFLMTRFMFPFMLIALFFGVMSLFMGLLALCTRIGSYLSSVLVWIAWVFQVITTCLMTACYVQARDHFNNNNQSSGLGKKAFGFMWAAVACLTLSTVLFCMGGAAGRDSSSGYSGRETRRRGFFASRRSSTRSRGSFRSKREDVV